MNNLKSRRSALGMLLSAAALPCLPTVARAQAASYPTKPVRLIVPSPPGGVSDISARLLGEFLSRKWGHQVLVENRAGAGGNIGMKAAAQSAPDGYTLFSATNSHMTIDPVVTPSLKLHTAFTPLALVSDNPIVIVANSEFPAKSLPGLVEAAKANPGRYGYATAGVASVPHLAAEWVASAAGIKLRHIPFKGGGPSAVAVASGEVPLASVALSSVVPFVRSGKIKPIVVTSAARIASVPDWPTVADAGFSDIDITVWTGLFAINGTPPAIVAKLEQDVAAIVSDPEFRERLDAVGSLPGRSWGKAFIQQIARETANIERIVRDANIRID
jgi:tripartite-type tricarboxylate transporter receptor subunit TctC